MTSCIPSFNSINAYIIDANGLVLAWAEDTITDDILHPGQTLEESLGIKSGIILTLAVGHAIKERSNFHIRAKVNGIPHVFWVDGMNGATAHVIASKPNGTGCPKRFDQMSVDGDCYDVFSPFDVIRWTAE